MRAQRSEHGAGVSGGADVPGRPANRLANETSPYLLQHAHNPVDWYPWGPEALERARRADRPILLSVGYAACHWCHVMERESFEDEETAALMNEHFVNIKVDREERPDIDGIYMDAVQAMTGHGGWPMTVFLTPDGTPFYAGTYFPKEPRHGMPSFPQVLTALAQAWKEQRIQIAEQGRRVMERIEAGANLQASNDPLGEEVLRSAFDAFRAAFDRVWGGFGGAPKFPQPMNLEFLLRMDLRGYGGALEMVTHTLEKMASGGMYDHVGGGFHRYSVDERWHVPHFEKMLYDNAQLARVYLHAWQVTRNERFRRTVRETLEYLLREMRHPGGGFYSSQDADSEGVEGKFFVWSWDELVETVKKGKLGFDAILPDARRREESERVFAIAPEAVAGYFGATEAGNWEGTNVLWTPVGLEEAAERAGASVEDFRQRVWSARRALFEAREKRVHPATDDKILAAWNGLAISAFAEAGRALGHADYLEAAGAAGDFVLSKLRGDDGRLLRAWREGRTGAPAYLDDYALMASACLTLYETTYDVRYFREARALVDDMLRLFRDEHGGGFFQTGSDAEKLVTRPKEVFDNAVPSGNSAAAEVLQRLSLFTGETAYETAGVSALRLVRDAMARYPTGFGYALSALDLYVSPAREVAIVGEPAEPSTRMLVHEVHDRYLPNVVLAVGQPDGDAAREVPLLADRPQQAGRPTAYVCERFVCQRPATTRDELVAQLADSETARA